MTSTTTGPPLPSPSTCMTASWSSGSNGSPIGGDLLEALLAQRVDEGAVDGLDVVRAVTDGGLARVEHRQELLGEPAGCVLDRLGLSAAGLPAEVRELGGEPLEIGEVSCRARR